MNTHMYAPSPYNYDRCEHCGAEVTRCKHLPAVDDSNGWDRILAEHEEGCSFAVTRNFQAHLEADDEGGRFYWLIDNETDIPLCKEPKRWRRAW